MTTTPRKPIELSTTIIAAISYVAAIGLFLIMGKALPEAAGLAVIFTPFVMISYIGLGLGEAIESLINVRSLKDAVKWATGFFLIIGVFLIAGGIHDMHLGIFLTGVASLGIARGLIELYPDAQ